MQRGKLVGGALGLQMICFELEGDTFGYRRSQGALRPFHFQLSIMNRDGDALRYRDRFSSNTRHNYISNFRLPIADCRLFFRVGTAQPLPEINRKSAIGNRQCQ